MDTRPAPVNVENAPFADSPTNLYNSYMDDNEEAKPVISSEALIREGKTALLYILGGIFLFAMYIGARFKFVGIVLALIAVIYGIVKLQSRDRLNVRPGLACITAGVLGMLVVAGVPPFRIIAGTILGMGAVGLFAAGIIKGITFLVNLKKMQ